jgi:hypothetical protein
VAFKYPYKDTYDARPYDAMADDMRSGSVITERVAQHIAETRTRPGFMATRLNNAGISAPGGGKWDWLMVRAEKERFKWEQLKKGIDLYPVSGGAVMRVGASGSWERTWG